MSEHHVCSAKQGPDRETTCTSASEGQEHHEQGASSATDAAPVRTVPGHIRDYLERGLSVVPQLAGKKFPCVNWKVYQDQRPTEKEWYQWLVCWPCPGVAVILGPVSGLFAIDIDGPDAHQMLFDRLGAEPIAPKVLSGSGVSCRYHLFFRYPEGISTLAKFTPWHPKLEFRGNRGIIVLPPSQHKSGNRYRFEVGRSFSELELPELPAAILEELIADQVRRTRGTQLPPETMVVNESHARTETHHRARAYVARIPAAIAGQGGDRLTYTVACRLVVGFGLAPDAAMPLLREYSQRCEPPWTGAELRHKLEQAAQEPGKRGYLLRERAGPGEQTGARRTPSATRPEGEQGMPPRIASLDNIQDIAMIDPARAKLFELIGGTHGLFRGAANWPTLDKLADDAKNGKYTNYQDALHTAISRFGGVIEIGKDGTAWLIRHLPHATDPSSKFSPVIDLCLPRPDTGVRPVRPDESGGPDPRQFWLSDSNRSACIPQTLRSIRLSRLAGSLLWYLHARVLALRTGKLLLADSELAEISWGQDRSNRPPNWRTELRTVLLSLSSLDVGQVETTSLISNIQWHGRLLEPVCDRKRHPERDTCSPACSLWYSRVPHHHYEITIGEGFLGLLNRFKVDKKVLEYDFTGDLTRQIKQLKEEHDLEARLALQQVWDLKEQGRIIKKRDKEFEAAVRLIKARRRAQYCGMVYIPLIPMIFGPVLDLTLEQRKLVLALLREVTRSRAKQRPSRPDRAHVFVHGRVPGSKRDSWIVCRALSRDIAYISLAGNGKNWGNGYRLATWLERAGHPTSEDDRQFRQSVRKLLKDLSRMAGPLCLLPLGFFRGREYDVEQIRELAYSRSQHETRILRSMCLRVYLPADYLDRWRQAVRSQIAVPSPSSGMEDQLLDLRVAMRRRGITQQALADYLKCDRSWLTKLLQGKQWPADLLERAMEYVREVPTGG